MYARILVQKYASVPYKTLFYRLELGLEISVGAIAKVPFRDSICLGVVEEITETIPMNIPKNSIRDVIEILEIEPLSDSYLKFINWLGSYYVASPSAVWRTCLPSGLMAKRRKSAIVAQEKLHSIKTALNSSQTAAVEEILANEGKKFLLHGVTGSGKTEIYCRVAQDVIKADKSVLILIPEISLTPQTIDYFRRRFNVEVIATHSKLTTITRRNIWLDANNNNEPKIYIGPRSALFLPIKQLGLIVVDEEHETSYKQDNSPTYSAVTAAAKLASLHNISLILGSASPSLSTYWLAKQAKLELIELPARHDGSKLPNTSVVKLEKGKSIISPELETEISKSLAKKKQVLLFLNRRGSANSQLCTNCGFVSKCKRCEANLTFHEVSAKLICHVCGLNTTPPAICPSCNSMDTLTFIGIGTQRVESLIATRFPSANVQRLDSDSEENIFDIYDQLKSGEIDILIGTQMVARGLDLANIDLVGVILADGMIYMPDFNADERAFSLLMQVIGRTGRGTEIGKAIIQTYTPDNPILSLAAVQDYKKFYEKEIGIRENSTYPPFAYLLKLSVAKKTSHSAKKLADDLATKLRSANLAISVLGPSQPLVARRPNGYVWQIIIKSRQRSVLQKVAEQNASVWTINLDPINII